MSRLTIREVPQTAETDSVESWLKSLAWESSSELSTAAVTQRDPHLFAKVFRKTLERRIPVTKLSPTKLAQRFPQYEQTALAIYESVKHGTDPDLEGRNGNLVVHLTQIVVLLDALTHKAKDCSSDQYLNDLRQAYNETLVITEPAFQVDSPLASMLIEEAAWSSAMIFSDIAGMKDRKKRARRHLSSLLDDWTDTDGTPHADLLPILPAWLASIIRSTRVAHASDSKLWSSSDWERVAGLLKSAILLTTPDGRLSFCDNIDLRPVLDQGVKVLEIEMDSPMFRLLSRLGKGGQRKHISRTSRLHKSDKSSPPIIQSDWAKIALLRDRWRPDADSVTLTHQNVTPQLELKAFGRSILQGDWKLNVRIDDQPLEITPDWDAVCWISDNDVDYLELQWLTDLDVILCRQVALIRGNHQLFVADSISTPNRKQSNIQLESSLRLSTTAIASFDSTSREFGIADEEVKIRCFPLALPMEQTFRASGYLDSTNGHLLSHQSGIGGAYAPILFDWHPKRSEASADWRKLTVTEDRRRLDTAEASAHRVRIGKDQLLVYRNLTASKKMRTVLGYHHNHETAIGRFSSEGEFDPLVLVE